ncbi:hypothetical protein BC834DRAFT_788632, partial [Gloeopeniophorella convolvens]
ALQLLEDEIESVATRLAGLKARRNATLPVSRLPFDALILIFESYKDAFNEAGAPSSSSISTAKLGWIVCSHVCRRWRQIILGTPSLWQDLIVDLGPAWLEESIHRSKPFP